VHTEPSTSTSNLAPEGPESNSWSANLPDLPDTAAGHAPRLYLPESTTSALGRIAYYGKLNVNPQSKNEEFSPDQIVEEFFRYQGSPERFEIHFFGPRKNATVEGSDQQTASAVQTEVQTILKEQFRIRDQFLLHAFKAGKTSCALGSEITQLAADFGLQSTNSEPVIEELRELLLSISRIAPALIERTGLSDKVEPTELEALARAALFPEGNNLDHTTGMMLLTVFARHRLSLESAYRLLVLYCEVAFNQFPTDVLPRLTRQELNPFHPKYAFGGIRSNAALSTPQNKLRLPSVVPLSLFHSMAEHEVGGGQLYEDEIKKLPTQALLHYVAKVEVAFLGTLFKRVSATAIPHPESRAHELGWHVGWIVQNEVVVFEVVGFDKNMERVGKLWQDVQHILSQTTLSSNETHPRGYPMPVFVRDLGATLSGLSRCLNWMVRETKRAAANKTTRLFQNTGEIPTNGLPSPFKEEDRLSSLVTSGLCVGSEESHIYPVPALLFDRLRSSPLEGSTPTIEALRGILNLPTPTVFLRMHPPTNDCPPVPAWGGSFPM